jgi:hypothetical protein
MKRPRPRSSSHYNRDRSGRIRGARASTEQGIFVTQDLLATLKQRQAEMKEAKRRYDKSRQSILDLHDAGASAEPGLLSFRVSQTKTCHFTAKNLAEILGNDEVEKLRRLIPATPGLRLRVFESNRPEGDDC